MLPLRPRTTGFVASGTSTCVVFDVFVERTVKKAATTDLTSSFDTYCSISSFSAKEIFASRKDSISQFPSIFSEFRLDRVNAFWMPSVSKSANGRFALSLVSSKPEQNTLTFNDVVAMPNSASGHISDRLARVWVPTSPLEQNFVSSDTKLFSIGAGSSRGIVVTGLSTGKMVIGHIRIQAHIVVRSPRDDFTSYVAYKPCYA